MSTAEEWRALAAEAIMLLLEGEGAATQVEMEAKISDQQLPRLGKKVDPHHLTEARRRLLDAGTIEQHRDTTRGGGLVTVYTLSNPTKAVSRAAGRKRLLTARHRSWSAPNTEWGPKPLPDALERVIYQSLLEASKHGYRLISPDSHGDIKTLLGATVPGGGVDNAAFYTPLVDGVPGQVVLVVVEAKNIRQWVYPQTQELYQLLDKCAQLQLAHPGMRILPVLVCRKMQFRTGQMAKQMGFHVISTWRQYVRPAVGAGVDNRKKFDEVDTELAFNLALHEGTVDQMVGHFVKQIPGRVQQGAPEEWSAVTRHSEIPELLTRMRDDDLPNRQATLRQLAAAVEDVVEETTEWGPITGDS